jgi:UDPglucose 6-dehydrogenase
VQVGIVGGGFVGVTTAVSLAEQGHPAVLVERDPERFERLRHGRLPFVEPGLDEALQEQMGRGRLEVQQRLPPEQPCEAILVCTGTPPGAGGRADLSQIESAVDDAARVFRVWDEPGVLIVKSTVPPGTLRNLVRPRLAARLERGPHVATASNPEFLREGSALLDARRPSRVLLGVDEPEAEVLLRRLYGEPDCPIVVTDPDTAETVKYVANALLATKIAFANEVANLCETLGVHVDDVMHAVGLDPRIGPEFLHAGLGFGGSCFPKDVAALRAVAATHGVRLGLLEAVQRNNETQPHRAVELAQRALCDLAGRRVALLGLSFKPDTSDVRESRARAIHEALRAAHADVVCYDPVAGTDFARWLHDGVRLAPDLGTALNGADVAIIHTAWSEFRRLPPDTFVRRMRTPVVVDGRRALDGPRLIAAGVTYLAVGDGRSGRNPHESSHSRRGAWNPLPARHEERTQGDAAAPG